MKKIHLSLFAAMVSMGASALTVSPAVKVETEGPAHNPVLSPDGKTMLFSSDNHTGLKALTLGREGITVLDDAPGAGFNPVFSTDGSIVVYQTAALVDGLLNRDARSFNLTDGTGRRMAGMSRDDHNLRDLAGQTDYVFADYDAIVVSRGGEVTKLQPVADAHSYLWATVSPDGSKIAFVEPFQGVFVSDIDGKNLVKIAAKGDFPAWAGDNLVTFTVSHDDGYVILDSTLKIYDLSTGITVNLTANDVKVGESTASANGNVVYSTLDGEVYLIQVK